jgi:heme-degrading monooxygenase HmoA
MVKAIFFHHVKDFKSWKKVFDSFYDTRKKYGEKSYSVGTVHGDPTNVFVINEWESLEKFNEFGKSEELHRAMKESGVISEPVITILDEVLEEVYHEH